MNKSVLIVIDMQKNFAAARDPITIASCKKLILAAQKETNPILFIEYRWHNVTLPSLTSLVKKYPFKDHISKENDDGSDVIVNYFERCKIKPKKLIACGINTECCVYDTVIGLTNVNKFDFDITVVKDACGTQWGTVESSENCFRQMRLRGVNVI